MTSRAIAVALPECLPDHSKVTIGKFALYVGWLRVVRDVYLGFNFDRSPASRNVDSPRLGQQAGE